VISVIYVFLTITGMILQTKQKVYISYSSSFPPFYFIVLSILFYPYSITLLLLSVIYTFYWYVCKFIVKLK